MSKYILASGIIGIYGLHYHLPFVQAKLEDAQDELKTRLMAEIEAKLAALQTSSAEPSKAGDILLRGFSFQVPRTFSCAGLAVHALIFFWCT